MSDLNPNIKHTVAFLQAHGFNTCDSGDGVTHDFECDRDYAYVSMVVDSCATEALCEEAQRLYDVLERHGITCSPVGTEGQPEIEATFDPSDSSMIIDLRYVTDDMLGPDITGACSCSRG